MGHVGLTPQSYRKFGGFKVQGREADSARQIRDDAQALAQAGCFAIVLECVPDSLAMEITARDRDPDARHRRGRGLRRPGARLPRRRRPDARPAAEFVRRYADLASVIEGAARAFTQDVKSGAFPSREESFTGVKPTLRRGI